MRTASHFKLAAVLIGVGALIVAAVGCHSVPITPVDKTATVTKPLADLRTHLDNATTEQDTAHQGITTVIKSPTLPPLLLPPLKTADDHLVKAQAETHAATTQAAVVNAKAVELGKANFDTEQKLHDAQAELNRVNMMWVAPRMKRWLWAFAILGGTSAFLFGVLKGPASVFPLLGVLRSIALAICTCGLSAAHWLGHTLATAFNHWHATPGTPSPVAVK